MNYLIDVINKIQQSKSKSELKSVENIAENIITNEPKFSEVILRSLNGKKKRLEAKND